MEDSLFTVLDKAKTTFEGITQLSPNDTLPIILPRPISVSEEQNWLVIISIVFGLLSSVAVILSAFFAYFQWKKSNYFNGIKYVQSIREQLYDSDVAEVLFWFDYDIPWYSLEFHRTKDPQIKVDKTLSVLDYACYLKSKKYIDEDQFSIIKYDIDRAICNFHVCEYLYNLHHWTKKCGTNMSFSFLLQYGRDCGKIKEDFDDINSIRYRHYLNFI